MKERIIINDKSIGKYNPSETEEFIPVAGCQCLRLKICPINKKHPKGRKVWVYRHQYKKQGKKTTFNPTIGEYPAVSLKDAKDKAEHYNTLKKQGIDLKEWKQEQAKKKAKAQANKFTPLLMEWASVQNWNDNTRKRRMRRLKLLTNHFKDRPLYTISQDEILDLIKQIESTHRQRNDPSKPSEVAERCKGFLVDFFHWAELKQYCTNNPTTAIKLAKSEYVHEKTDYGNRPSLCKPKEFGALLANIEKRKDTMEISTYHNLKLLAYLCVRSSDVRLMKWADIDFHACYWDLTPIKGKSNNKVKMVEKMKVPLSRQVIEILQAQHKITGNYAHVFHSEKAKTNHIISENTANDQLKNMGYQGKHCVHGFRSSGKSLLMGELDYNHLITEMVLGHITHTGNRNEDPYMRADLYEQRTELMQRWADYIDDLAQGKDTTKYKGVYRQPPQEIIKALLQMIGRDELLKLIG